MATVKIHYDDSAKRMEKYLTEKREPNGLTTEHLCMLDGVTSEFTGLQRDHNSRGNNSIHLIQSWSPTESRTLPPDLVHKMGVELVSRFAPGHQYIVQTHTDQPHSHNHILINPVSLETGKRIQNKLGHIETLRNINDEIARDRGLSVLPPQEKLRRPGPNEHVRRINQYRGRSYIVDMASKAHFAREHATGYEEYAAILGAFDVQVRVEPKNITYFYPGKEHGKRGRNLDPRLDKPALEQKFAANRARLVASPELRATVSELAANYRTPGKVPTLAVEKTQPYAGLRRSLEFDQTTPAQVEETIKSFIPLEEVLNAKCGDIIGYCKRADIPLERREEGRTVLRDREHVEVNQYGWVNHKNKTRGNAIDFVANHRQTSYLHAISILNNNPRLMALEKHLGESKKPYQSFHFFRGERIPREAAIKHLAKFLGHPTHHPVHGELLKRQSVHVTAEGVVRFFTEREDTGLVEYLPNDDGKGYTKRRRGEISTPLYERRGRSEELQLFVDPATFLKRSPHSLGNRSKQTSVLALLEPNVPLALRAATAKNIKRVRLVCDQADAKDPALVRFRDDLADALNPFSIDISMAWEPSREFLSRERDEGLDLGRSLSFHGV
ncbi:relaxase/mobilization nuclease domain-containing protein [Bdellovibrionota bacterium FG-1]